MIRKNKFFCINYNSENILDGKTTFFLCNLVYLLMATIVIVLNSNMITRIHEKITTTYH